MMSWEGEVSVSIVYDVVGVYYSNQNLKGPPAFNVPREDARDQVEHFMAKWVKRAKAIQMNYTAPSLWPTATSLRMGESFIEKFMLGGYNKKSVQKLLAAYAPIRA